MNEILKLYFEIHKAKSYCNLKMKAQSFWRLLTSFDRTYARTKLPSAASLNLCSLVHQIMYRQPRHRCDFESYAVDLRHVLKLLWLVVCLAIIQNVSKANVWKSNAAQKTFDLSWKGRNGMSRIGLRFSGCYIFWSLCLYRSFRIQYGSVYYTRF